MNTEYLKSKEIVDNITYDIPARGANPIPWCERPAQCSDIVWRHQANPIIKRGFLDGAGPIYNSAVVPYNDAYAGVFRVDSKTAIPFLHVGTSPDGLIWDIDSKPLPLHSRPLSNKAEFGYDPRVCKIEDTYYITWCNGYHGPTIGLAQTRDFKNFHQMENVFLPFNRNGTLFPRKINGKYAMLSRPSDNGHTKFGDIFYSESPDLEFWGRHRHVMGTTDLWWESAKIGAGCVPIETPHGWLLLYHGVMNTCNGFVYSMGAALLDLEKPWIVRNRCKNWLLQPEKPYEIAGLVPNVIFPCAALHEPNTGRLAIYYGAADTDTCLAFAQIDEIIEYITRHSWD